ncbi:hypothetical protein BDR26DRAFT_868928 [Obelidium mucronatum]|nr:hypothetical protein BDR26DRAFT_868928 [Obelidium mucronatum]
MPHTQAAYQETTCQYQPHNYSHQQPYSMMPPSPPVPNMASPAISSLSTFSTTSTSSSVRGAGGINLLLDSPELSPAAAPLFPALVPDLHLPESHTYHSIPHRTAPKQLHFHAMQIPSNLHTPPRVPLYSTPLPCHNHSATTIATSMSPFNNKNNASPVMAQNSRKQNVLICPWDGCGKSFLRSDTFEAHYNEHTNSKPHNCVHCVARFTRRHDYLRHLKTVHSNGVVQSNSVCQHCQKAFSRPDSLRRHERKCLG